LGGILCQQEPQSVLEKVPGKKKEEGRAEESSGANGGGDAKNYGRDSAKGGSKGGDGEKRPKLDCGGTAALG